jgi:hypothetical protein
MPSQVFAGFTPGNVFARLGQRAFGSGVVNEVFGSA